MAYTPVTKMPSTLKYFQWSTPTNPNPRLLAPISATDTIITVTSAPLDHTGAVVTGDFLMGIKNEQSYVETVYVPEGAVSVDGKTLGTIAIPVVRGVRLEGLDYNTADSTLAAAHNQDSPVYCNISAVNFVMMINALNGSIGSGGLTWKIGKETDDSIYVYAFNADTNKPYWRYDKVTNQWLYSNDGVSESPFGTGAGLTGGDGITVGGGDIDIDTTDTTIFVETTAGAADAGKVAKLDGAGLIKKANVEVLKDVTSTAAELNKLAGASANVTATNLNTMTAGAASDADALHTHATLTILSNYGSGQTTSPHPAQVIAHGLGRTPKAIFITTSGVQNISFGMCDSAGHQGFSCLSHAAGDSNSGSNASCFSFFGGGGNTISGVISNITSTTFTITWTHAGVAQSPYYYWLVM